jgi:hypothetical protein
VSTAAVKGLLSAIEEGGPDLSASCYVLSLAEVREGPPFRATAATLPPFLLAHEMPARQRRSRQSPDDTSLTHYLAMPDPNQSSIDLTPPDDPAGSLVSVAILLLQQGVALLRQTVRTDKQVSAAPVASGVIPAMLKLGM